MHHGIHGSNLSRDKDDRISLRKNLLRDLYIRGKISTTLAKAKAIRSEAEKLITKAKRGTLSDLTVIHQSLGDKHAVRSLLKDAKDRFSNRNSGYTRIVRSGFRKGDNAEEAVLSFVDDRKESLAVNKEKKDSKVKKENKVSGKQVKLNKTK